MTAVYRRLEQRATILLKGWEHTLGDTPDDLALAALRVYLDQRMTGKSQSSSWNLAFVSIKRDVIDLHSKLAYGESYLDRDYAGAEWLTALNPDTWDWLGSMLDARGCELVRRVYEDKQPLAEIARLWKTPWQTLKDELTLALLTLRSSYPVEES
jgi:hypothetical protein